MGVDADDGAPSPPQIPLAAAQSSMDGDPDFDGPSDSKKDDQPAAASPPTEGITLDVTSIIAEAQTPDNPPREAGTDAAAERSDGNLPVSTLAPLVTPLNLSDAVPPPNNNASYFSRKIHIPAAAAQTFRYTAPESNIERAQSASGEGLFDDGSPLPVPRREQPKQPGGLKKKLTKVVRAARLPPSAGGRRRKKVRNGECVFKGHKSWEIVLSIQFGLRYTSELLQSSDSSDPNEADFYESLAFDFNPVDDFRSNSHSTEVNHFAKWVHPAPFVYRQIRDKFKVPEEEFLEATCSESRIRELPTPGKSGALFYITDDEKYFMKTITGVEERMLMSMLPAYYTHINEYPNTLLTKYLAHFSVKTTRNNHIRMVVMASIFGLSNMIEDEDEYYKHSFGQKEENAPYEVAYRIDESGAKRGIRVSMGIIDFLQRFRSRKKAEYGMRIVQSCSCSAASVAPPSLYRRRFIDFLKSRLLGDPDFDISKLVQGRAALAPAVGEVVRQRSGNNNNNNMGNVMNTYATPTNIGGPSTLSP